MKRKPDYQLRQELLHSFRKSTKNYSEFANSMKNSSDRGEVSSVLLQLFRSLPAYERLIYGNVFPRTIDQLGLGTTYFYIPESLENELYWLLIPIRHHKAQILEFIELRDAIYDYIMLGQYDVAIEKLNASVKHLGYSMWFFEMKTIIYCQQNKMKEVYSMVSDVNKRKRNDKSGYVSYLLSMLLERSKKDISAYKYDYDLISQYKRNKNDFQTDRFLYFLYRLNYYQNYDRKNEDRSLVMESTNSLVDRYILIINALKSYYIREDADRKMVAKFIKRLYSYVPDPKLMPFIAVDNISEVTGEYYDERFISILDSYYKGQYDDVKQKSREYLLSHPNCFDVVKLYNRALIFLGKGYQPVNSNVESVLNNLSVLVYSQLTGKDTDKHLYALYQLLKNISGLPIAAGLDFFIREEQNLNRYEEVSLLSIEHFDPLFTKLLKSDAAKNRYLNYGEKHIPDSVVISYQSRRVKKQISNDDNVVAYIRNTDNARIAFDKGNYQQALDMWRGVYENNRKSFPTLQVAVQYIYECHLHLHDYSRALSFYVERYLENKALISKVDTSAFAKILHKQRYKGFRYDLDLLIFVLLTAESEPEKSFVVDKYCRYKEVELPSQLVDKFDDEPKAKIEEFYHLVYDDDLLRHYIKISSTQEMLEEKRRIIHFLLSLDSSNKKKYEQEEAELIEELVVYNSNKKLDEAKIYANDQAIIKYELNRLEEDYNRFLAQYSLMKTGLGIFIVDNSQGGDEEELSKDVSIFSAHVKYTDSAVFEVANEIFDSIRDAYLRSKFGLGTYLSTRIRHGVFEGEIRSVLSGLNLILNTEKGKYVPTEYWRRTYNLAKDDNDGLMDALQKLSQGTDFAISNFKSKVLRIRTSESEEGYFNYVIDPKKVENIELDILVRTSNYEDFCKETIAYLRGMTDLNLSRIREQVHNDLSSTFVSLFTDFDSYVQKLSPSTFSSDLSSALLNARTRMAHKLDHIEKWFYLQNAQFEDLTLKNILDIVWENTKTYYPNVPVNINVSWPNDLLVRADYGIHFIDLMRIFFSNMFRYSKEVHPHREMLVSANLDNHILRLHFENETNKPDKVINDRLRELDDQSKLLDESGSGIIKARKIVKYDLKCLDNDVAVVASGGKCLVDVNIDMLAIEK